MKLRLTPRAARDIAEIGDYIRNENPDAALRVQAAIIDSLEVLTRYPRVGRAQSVVGVRKLVTRKYRYLVYYTADERDDEIIVLAVQHPARDRSYSDE